MGGLVASEERRDLQEKIWSGIIEALKDKVPEVEQIAQRR